MLCEYGCKREAIHQFKNGKWCCSKIVTKCPAVPKRNQTGKNNSMFGKPSWNKGLTKDDPRVKKYSESSKKTIREKILRGEHHAWNKGLTIETSEGVRKYSKGMSERKKGKPNLKRRKPLTLSKIRSIVRLKSTFRQRLYCNFTFPILKRDNFTCQKCGKSKGRLEVHHLTPFRNIFDEAIKELNLSNDITLWKDSDIINLEEKILNKHNIMFGITVCITCHREIDEMRR
jgi:5-methylcytosine-specific restriction endonuclease McrA